MIFELFKPSERYCKNAKICLESTCIYCFYIIANLQLATSKLQVAKPVAAKFCLKLGHDKSIEILYKKVSILLESKNPKLNAFCLYQDRSNSKNMTSDPCYGRTRLPAYGGHDFRWQDKTLAGKK
jgi:hypothetical protein